MKPAYEVCGVCKLYVYHLPYMNCAAPTWVTLKQAESIEKDAHIDCPKRDKISKHVYNRK
jgi:hypothetical protein